ncbi:ABC transporter ATP-binding protein [Nocardioides endophyticus]|uniref:ABC transporter ATP-binding protein n=1 Tax=Nocardioides endophyticus TaxID=1353775 RepID=UPI0031EDA336
MHPFDLEVDDGEFIVFLGPSRSGKSTILRMVAGLEPLDGGRIEFDGKDMSLVEPRHRDVGMFFQNYALYPNKTGRQNIAASLMRRGADSSAVRARVDEVADLLGVSHLLDRHPKTYSGGEQQRVAIGRVIARRASVFAFDEPLSNLDALVRLRLRTEFKRISRELGITTLYVTPDQVEALALADRVVVLDEGRIVQVGTPQELYERPANAFVASFVGATPMNTLTGTLKGDHLLTEDGATIAVYGVTAMMSADAQGMAMVGIRPESVSLEEGGPNKVHLVESLGRQTLVHLKVGEKDFRVLAPATTSVREGDNVALRCDAKALHHFSYDGSQRVN